jgi:hypothetical protein
MQEKIRIPSLLRSFHLVWNKGGGKVLPGLVRRRAVEVKLFQTPSSVSADPC